MTKEVGIDSRDYVVCLPGKLPETGFGATIHQAADVVKALSGSVSAGFPWGIRVTPLCIF